MLLRARNDFHAATESKKLSPPVRSEAADRMAFTPRSSGRMSCSCPTRLQSGPTATLQLHSKYDDRRLQWRCGSACYVRRTKRDATGSVANRHGDLAAAVRRHPILIAPQTALRLQELLGGAAEFSLTALPRIQLSVQSAGSGAPEGMPTPATGATRGGWRLSAADRSWHLNVEAGSVSVESSSYGSWASDFSPRLQRVLGALEDVGPPVVESRLGLRYINILVGSAVGRSPLSAPGELGGMIAPWLLGPLNQSRLQDFVQMTQGRVVFGFEHANAILNHGVVSTENGSWATS